ncbi:hypothetical protein PO124_11010 [Bacillus licheniformis]|nr:hypothetical protein [Bacillus licheniformis]
MRKIACGADYFISQPVYSEEQLIKSTRKRGILKHRSISASCRSPAAATRNSSTTKSPASSCLIQSAKDGAGRKRQTKQAEEGLAIARSLLDAACDLFNGIYLITPFCGPI